MKKFSKKNKTFVVSLRQAPGGAFLGPACSHGRGERLLATGSRERQKSVWYSEVGLDCETPMTIFIQGCMG